jgi:hypothetical protein
MLQHRLKSVSQTLTVTTARPATPLRGHVLQSLVLPTKTAPTHLRAASRASVLSVPRCASLIPTAMETRDAIPSARLVCLGAAPQMQTVLPALSAMPKAAVSAPQGTASLIPTVQMARPARTELVQPGLLPHVKPALIAQPAKYVTKANVKLILHSNVPQMHNALQARRALRPEHANLPPPRHAVPAPTVPMARFVSTASVQHQVQAARSMETVPRVSSAIPQHLHVLLPPRHVLKILTVTMIPTAMREHVQQFHWLVPATQAAPLGRHVTRSVNVKLTRLPAVPPLRTALPAKPVMRELARS